MFWVLQDVDVAPTPQAAQAVPVLNQSTQNLLKQWAEIQKTDSAATEVATRDIAALPQVAGDLKPSEGITTNQDEE